jgi:hypothetical protein
MAMKKTHDAVYAGEKYTDREGNEKTRYVNMGVMFTRDDGSVTAKIESIPVGFNGWINFYPPKDEAGKGERERPQRGQRQGAPLSDDGDDVPF